MDNLGTITDIVSSDNYQYTSYNLGIIKIYVGFVTIPSTSDNVLVITKPFQKCSVVATETDIKGYASAFSKSTKDGFYIYSTTHSKAVTFIAVTQ